MDSGHFLVRRGGFGPRSPGGPHFAFTILLLDTGAFRAYLGGMAKDKLTPKQREFLREAVEGVLNSTGRVYETKTANVTVLNNLVQKRAITYTTYRPGKRLAPTYKVQILASAVHLL